MFRRERKTSQTSQHSDGAPGQSFSRTSSNGPGTGPSPAQTPPVREKRRSFFGMGGSKDKDKQTDSRPSMQGGQSSGAMGRTTSRMSINPSENDHNQHNMNGRPTQPNGQQIPQQQMSREQWEAQQRQMAARQQGQGGGGGGQPLAGQPSPRQHVFNNQHPPQQNGQQHAPPPPSRDQDQRQQPQQQQQQQQQAHQRQPSSDLARRSSLTQPHEPSSMDDSAAKPAQMGEIQFALDLIMAQPNKVYATSPPTLKSMVAAGADGKHPKAGPPGTPGNDWQEVWVELRGIILHVWNMKEVAEANARGEDKHPNRINTTDSFVDLIQPLPPTRHDPQSGPHPFVFSINTAGLNSVLFSCPSKEAMMEWVTAIRLAGYESSRLMEIYTGHLIRSIGTPLPSLAQQGNKIAGWFDVRTFGSRSWTHLWVVLSIEGPPGSSAAGSNAERRSSVHEQPKPKAKNRISRLFGGASSPEPTNHTTPFPPAPGESSPTGLGSRRPSDMSLASTAGGRPVISAQFYTTPPKATLSRSPASSGLVPFLTVTDVTQAFAVFPEVETEIDNSAMFKLEGHLSGEAMGPSARRDEGWILMIPVEKERESDGFVPGKRADMLKWLAAFHDAFGLYGRPGNYSWDARDPKSLLFAHPHGAQQDDLFIVKPNANPDEISISRASFVRSRFRDILIRRMSGQPPLAFGPAAPGANAPQQRQPLQQVPEAPENPTRSQTPVARESEEAARQAANGSQGRASVDSLGRGAPAPAPKSSSFQLPPLSFGEEGAGSPPTTQAAQMSPPPRSNLREPSSPPPVARQPIAGGTRSPTAAAFAQTQHQQQPTSSSYASAREQPYSQTNGNGHAQAGSTTSGSNKSASMQVLPGTIDARSSRPNSQLADTDSPNLVTSPDSYHAPSSLGQAAAVASAPVAFGSQQSHHSGERTPRGSSRPTSSASSSFPHRTGAVVSPPSSATPAQQQFQPAKNDFGPDSDEDAYGVSTVARPGATEQSQSRGASPPPVSSTTSSGSRYLPTPTTAPASEATHNARLSPVPSHSSQQLPVLAPEISTGSRPEPQVEATAPLNISQKTPPLASGGFGMSSSPPSNSGHGSGKREMVNLGRRPSGARDPPTRRVVSEAASTMPVVSDEEEPSAAAASGASSQQQRQQHAGHVGSDDHHDHNADALAALSFLDATSPGSSSPVKARALPPQPQSATPAQRDSLPPIQTSFSPPAPAPAPLEPEFPSSFGPSKSAAERRARAEASQQQRHDALTKPGKGKGAGTGGKKSTGNWARSESDSEEDEEDDEEGSVDSHDRRAPASQQQGQGFPQATSSQSDLSGRGSARPLPQNPGQQQNYDQSQYGRQDLQPPRPAFANGSSPSRQSSGYDYNNGDGNRSSSYGGGGDGRAQSSYYGGENDHQLHQPVPRQGAINGGGNKARGSVWTNHLGDAHGGRADNEPASSTFVAAEENPALTKAFNPQGLLQAGLEDRNDRSAKRQEEIARESGSSLVNVPSKPPPPQTGLLGAITAHERDRAREGGVGAAMTERERDRRAAEERARKIDALQREQLEAMSGQQGHPGSPGPYGYNPYGQQQMMPPWMGGFPQMGGMGGGGSMYGGYGGGGMDPQMAAMMAAQQAYQQAMMSYSQAGSQAGGGSVAGGDDNNQRMSSPFAGGGGSQFGGGGGGGPGWGMPQFGYGGGFSPSMYGMPNFGGPGSPMGFPSPQPPFGGGGGGGGSQSGHSHAGSSYGRQQQQPDRRGSPGQQESRSRLNSNNSRPGEPISRRSTPKTASRSNLHQEAER